MAIFLFGFGYETPSQHANNKRNSWDDEDSEAVFIECDDAEAALAWGREIAEAFVQRLWVAAGKTGPSWKAGNYSNWIETDPKVLATIGANDAPRVKIGEHPRFPSENS